MNVDLTETEIQALHNALSYFYAVHQDRGWNLPYYANDVDSARTKLEATQQTKEHTQ